MKTIQPAMILLLLLSTGVKAQEYREILRDIFYDAEYWLVEESYPDALVEYEKLYSRGYEDNANINYRIGVCYLNIPGEKAKSIPYLEKATRDITPRYRAGNFRESSAPYDAWLYLGNAYRIDNQLNKAIECYDRYKELLDDEDSEMDHYADQQIEACRNAQSAMENPVFQTMVHTGERINSGTSDFNPVVSHNEEVMIFMRSLPFYEAILLSRKENGEWTEPVNITPEFQPEAKLYVNSISHDGNEIFLNQEDNFDSEILVSTHDGDRWSRATPLGKTINTKFWESHGCISNDGEHLYFASNRKDGQGGMDIWMASRDAGGLWSEPQNLGEVINTELNEDHPFLTDNDSKLYFVSQGHYNIGGYDIFVSEKLHDGSWSAPRNLGYPVNTTDDDLFFVPVGEGDHGYHARYEEDNLGARDIYRIQMFDTEEAYLAATQPPAPEEEAEVEVSPVPETAEPPVPPADTTPEPEPEPMVTYLIRPVFFEFDKSSLTQESIDVLEEVLTVMEAYPSMVIEAVGHTDSKGPESYNMALSKRRAASVTRFFAQRGIEADRLKSNWQGENQPVAINTHEDGSDSPAGRRLNRRVEIHVLEPRLPNIQVEEVKVPDALKR